MIEYLLLYRHYIVYAGWANETTPMISWMNRTQNVMIYCVYTTSNGECKTVCVCVCVCVYVCVCVCVCMHVCVYCKHIIICSIQIYEQRSDAWIELVCYIYY